MSGLSHLVTRSVLLVAVVGIAWARDDDPAGSLHGVVVDSNGVGVPQAQVRVSHRNRNMQWVQSAESPTVGPQGDFSLLPPNEAGLLSAEAPGMTAAYGLLVEPGAVSPAALTLELLPEVDFQLTVVDEAGLAVAGARPRLNLRGGSAHVLTLDPHVHRVEREMDTSKITDSNGQASLRTPAWPSWLRVYADGFTAWSGPVDPTQPLMVVLNGQRVVSGIAVDSSGQPIGCTVTASGVPPVWTKDPGNFAVRVDRRETPVVMIFEAAGLGGVRLVDVSAGDVKDLRMQLEPTMKLSGRVVKPQGAPYPAYVDLAYVRTAEGGWGSLPTGWPGTMSATDSAGDFEFIVPGPGEYLVLIDGMNGPAGKQVTMRAGVSQQITVADSDRDNIEFDIAVRDAVSGAEVVPTFVEVTEGAQFIELWSGPAHGEHHYANGLAYLVPGPGTLRVIAPGYRVHEQKVELLLGAITRIDVELASARRAWMQLVDSNGQPLAFAQVALRDEHAAAVRVLSSEQRSDDSFTTDHRGEACIDGLPSGPVTLIVDTSAESDTSTTSTSSAELEGVLPAGDSGRFTVKMRATDGHR